MGLCIYNKSTIQEIKYNYTGCVGVNYCYTLSDLSGHPHLRGGLWTTIWCGLRTTIWCGLQATPEVVGAHKPLLRWGWLTAAISSHGGDVRPPPPSGWVVDLAAIHLFLKEYIFMCLCLTWRNFKVFGCVVVINTNFECHFFSKIT